MPFPTPPPLPPTSPKQQSCFSFSIRICRNGPDSCPSIIPAVPIPIRDVPTKPSPSLLFRQALHFPAAPSRCCSSPGLCLFWKTPCKASAGPTPHLSPHCHLPGFGWLPLLPIRKSLHTGSCRGWEGKRGIDEMSGARPTKWASLGQVGRAPQVRLAGQEPDLESGKGTLA